MTSGPHSQAELVIAYDGSPAARDAVHAAGRLLMDREVVVLTVYGPLVSAETMAGAARIAVPDEVVREGAGRLAQEAEGEARAVAQEGADRAVEAGLRACAETRVRTGSAWSAILAEVREHQAQLIICGARGRGTFARIALGSTSSGLVHNAHRPVLVASGDDRPSAGPIALAYDGSEGARAAVVTAGALFHGREAVVVHAWETPLTGTLSGAWLYALPGEEMQGIVADVEQFFAVAGRDVAEEGAALASEHRLDARAVALEAREASWRAIAEAAADEDAALVMAGSRGRGPVEGALLGSVSLGLAHGAQRPVMVVPRSGDA